MAFNWGAFFRGLQTSSDALQAREPLPPSSPPALTGAEIADRARQLQAALPAVIAWLEAHPDSVQLADGVLGALRDGGLSWAGTVEGALDAAPGALAKADAWLPMLIGLLTAFQPASAAAPGKSAGR